jgi:hypothetical protein
MVHGVFPVLAPGERYKEVRDARLQKIAGFLKVRKNVAESLRGAFIRDCGRRIHIHIREPSVVIQRGREADYIREWAGTILYGLRLTARVGISPSKWLVKSADRIALQEAAHLVLMSLDPDVGRRWGARAPGH